MVVHGPYPVGEPRVEREARAAQAAGWEVDVVAMRRPSEPREERVDDVRVVRLPLSHRRGGGAVSLAAEYGGFTALATIALLRESTRRRYDVVQVHSPPEFLVACALVPKLLGGRVVLDVHDLSSDLFAMRFGGSRIAPLAETLLRLSERAAARFADAVVTVHDPYRDELARRGVSRRKIVVVLNSVDEGRLPRPAEAAA